MGPLWNTVGVSVLLSSVFNGLHRACYRQRWYGVSRTQSCFTRPVRPKLRVPASIFWNPGRSAPCDRVLPLHDVLGPSNFVFLHIKQSTACFSPSLHRSVRHLASDCAALYRLPPLRLSLRRPRSIGIAESYPLNMSLFAMAYPLPGVFGQHTPAERRDFAYVTQPTGGSGHFTAGRT
ncbi:hypothetical protein BV25DRAFT_1830106 [Artomyces pyxidatus]|uniref:Uncharacterized protein n=1 Tax=Artomyces pyxidatus TaxID=48021 RepID=A0ACB8SRV3_9AGAM|nr:hypothetical protein BV25DRAFT_1830106 [Artomyces pyxidatus]